MRQHLRLTGIGICELYLDLAKKTVGRWADGRMGGLVEPPSRSIGAAITACAPLIIASEMHGSQRSKVDYHYHVRPLAELQRNSVPRGKRKIPNQRLLDHKVVRVPTCS